MLKEPYERIANPIDKSINPIPNFTGPDGLNFDCQILERTGANTIIKKEFKIANHDARTSVASFTNLYLHPYDIPQIIIKLSDRNILDIAYSEMYY